MALRSLLRRLTLTVAGMLPATVRSGDCADPARFHAEVLGIVQRAFPKQGARSAPGDVLEAGGMVFRLDNLRKLVCASPLGGPEDRARLIRDHFEKAFQLATHIRSGKEFAWADARDHVVVQLVTEELASQLNLLRKPLVQGAAVVVVLDLPTAYLYVGDAHPALWGVSADELFERAVENLALRTRGEMRTAGDSVDRVLLISERDGYDAARILTPRLRTAAARLLGDPFRAAIPNRDFLVMWARGNRQLADQAGANARRDFDAQPYPISPCVLEVWADGRISAVPSLPSRP